MARIAFDLDETLGVPIIDGSKMIGFQTRSGCRELLGRLSNLHTLVLWTVSIRRYAEKALVYGLAEFFCEVYTWDEIPDTWKDVRRLGLEFLIDDSDHHKCQAEKHGIADRYIVVPVYGAPEDVAKPFLWIERIDAKLSESSDGHDL